MLGKLRQYFSHLFADDSPDDLIYDPVHVAGVLVACLAALGALYWTLWGLLVCEGGLAAKLGPALQVLSKQKTLQDFGYRGYPYELGIFEGWIINVAALVVLLAALTIGWKIYHTAKPETPPAVKPLQQP